MSLLCDKGNLLARLEIERVFFQVRKIDELEDGDVAGGEADAGSHVRHEGFLPAGDAEAPFVPGDEPGKTEFRDGRRKVVTAGFREGKKLVGHLDADGVEAGVAGTGTAITIAVKAGQRTKTTALQRTAEDVGLRGSHRRTTISGTPRAPNSFRISIIRRR